MKVYFIRHSLTEGNLHRRYIGVTDQPLCPEGIQLIEEKKNTDSFQKLFKHLEINQKNIRYFSSPLTRCRETLALLFPQKRYDVIRNLRECDFGIFENKNYLELSDVPEYQEWIDSNGTLPFPKGESVEGFNARICEGFLEAMALCEETNTETALFVVHGGTIMAIMDAFADSDQTYYDFMVKNVEGYEADYCDGHIKSFKKIES